MFTLDSLNPTHFWNQIPALSRLFLSFLGVVTVYILTVLIWILSQLRPLRRLPSTEVTVVSIRPHLTTLQQRTANLRQLLLLAFFLFAFCFFLQIPASFMTLGDSRVPGFTIILMQLGAYFEYATDVCFLFFLLHSLQWSVSARLEIVIRRSQLS